MTHFILFDPQELTREGFRSYLISWFAASHVWPVANSSDLKSILGDNPDAVVIIDYALSDIRSVDQLKIMAVRYPRAKWVIVGNEFGAETLRALCGEGCISVALKDSTADDLRRVLMSAVAGTSAHSAGVLAALEARDAHIEESPLTASETEILKLIVHGMTAKEIAAKRFLSPHTVVTHKKNIFRKLGVSNVHEATKWALRAGLVEMMEYYI